MYIITKKEAIKMLQDSPGDYVIVNCLNSDINSFSSPKSESVENGIRMIEEAMSVGFNKTPVMGSLDLFKDDIAKQTDYRGKYDNILFAIRI